MTQPQPQPLVRSTTEIGLEWFVNLRWGAGAAQGAAIAVSAIAGASYPVAPLLAVAALTPLTNALFLLARRRWVFDGARAVRALLLLDLALLTALLALSGGPSNPFSVLYLVYVSLAATLLSTGWTWGAVAASVACYAVLFVAVPVGQGMHHDHGAAEGAMGYGAHLWGMFIALTIAAVLVAQFVTRLARALRSRDQALAAAQERLSRSERLAAVMGLAAGTAHEMGTPLATIALISKELERTVSQRPGAEELVADARLIRAEVERCRALLEQLGARAGAPPGERPEAVPFAQLVDRLRAALPDVSPDRLAFDVAPGVGEVVVPARALVQVLSNLVRNAVEASPPAAPVRVRASRSADGLLRLEVHDDGRGMSPDVLAQASQPFFTTKPSGTGMGLGLFLVESFAQQLGGRLTLASRPGEGTHATLELPA